MYGFEYIKKNLSELSAEISELEKIYGNKITLVAVTKSGTDEELLALAECGIKNIGENRPQEVKRRGELLKNAGFDIAFHEIGNLQRNKVKMIAESVSLIHSVDSVELAREIDKRAAELGKIQPVLIEVNCAEEEQKGGISPACAKSFAVSLKEFKNIQLRGLMTMGPVTENPEELRPYFKKTRELFESMKSADFFVGDGILSMGMSDSYRIAIEEGSTLVRVGRKLFVKN